MAEWRTLEDLRAERQVAVVIADHFGVISYVNRAFEALFGWQGREAVGRPLTIIIPESFRGAHQAGFSRLLATNQPRLLNQSIRLKAVDKQGKEFMAEHFIIGERDGNGLWTFGAAIHRAMPR